MDIKEEILAQMDSALRPEFDKAINNTIEGAFKEDVKTLGVMVANSIKCQWEVMKPHLFYTYCLGVKAQEAKAQAVPDLGELQERIAGHQYYHDEHGHMVVDMDDVVKEISGFDIWKTEAVPEGYVLVPVETLNEALSWAKCAASESWTDAQREEIDKHYEVIESAMIEAQGPAND